jgi:hypothetical protein
MGCSAGIPGYRHHGPLSPGHVALLSSGALVLPGHFSFAAVAAFLGGTPRGRGGSGGRASWPHANADTRTHYVRYCAEIFSNGDSRLMPLLVENLVTQVRRQRRATSGDSKQPKIAAPQPWGDCPVLKVMCPMHRMIGKSSGTFAVATSSGLVR